MDPNQQPASYNPQQYDFITNPAKPPKKSLIPLPRAGGSKTKMILLYGGGALVFIMIMFILYGVLFGGNSSTDKFKTLAQQQTEIIRVAKIGQQKASSTPAQNLAVMTEVNLTSQQSELVSYLAKQKVKLSSKYLSETKDTSTDASLATAETNGRFDDAFIQEIRDQLGKYQASVKDAFASSGKNGKVLLNNEYSQAGLILSSIPATSNQ